MVLTIKEAANYFGKALLQFIVESKMMVSLTLKSIAAIILFLKR